MGGGVWFSVHQGWQGFGRWTAKEQPLSGRLELFVACVGKEGRLDWDPFFLFSFWEVCLTWLLLLCMPCGWDLLVFSLFLVRICSSPNERHDDPWGPQNKNSTCSLSPPLQASRSFNDVKRTIDKAC